MSHQYNLISIKKSTLSDKKMTAIFENRDTFRTKTVHFGAKGYSDYTIHKDDERKNRYLIRHKSNENWNNPLSPGALSRWILWNKKTLRASILDYKKKFKFNKK